MSGRIKIKSPFDIAKGLFFAVGFLLVSSAAAVAPVRNPGEGQAWDEHEELRLSGEKLEYFQESKILKGEGGVELDFGTLRLKADKVLVDMESNTLVADGEVIWADNGNTIYASHVELNLTTQQGRADALLFTHGTWVAAGTRAVKSSDKDLTLQEAQATSCLREHPHYRLVSKQIVARLGERVTAKNVLVYVGVAPVFYLPYYTQSLKDPRPPFEIRPGYDRINGMFVRTAYNYYFSDEEWGSFRFDWMDKTGTGYGLSQHYKLLGGEGDAQGYYTRDKNNPDNQSWTGRFGHSQDFGGGLRLLASADFISEYKVNETYSLNSVDTYQNRKFLSLQSGQKDYSWNLDLSDTQQLQQKLGGSSGEREYVTTQRSLPSLSFNRYSKPLFPGKALYYGMSGGLARVFVPVTATTAFGNTVFDESSGYYNSSATLVPSLSYTQRLIRGLALSGNFSFSQSYIRGDELDGADRGTSIGNAIFNLRIPLRRLRTDLGYRNGRQFSQIEKLRFAGLTENRLTLNSTLSLSEATSLLAGTDYDMLPYEVKDDSKRLGLIRLQGLYAPTEHRSLTLVSTFHAPSGEVKTFDANFNLNDSKRRWETGGGFSWVNNRIVQLPSTIDTNAPLSFGFEDPHRSPDQALVNWRASMVLTEHWSVSGYQRLDLASKAVAEQAFSVLRDLHCWNLELYGRDRSYTGWQFGFTLTLKALPRVQASSSRITSDLFDDVSFGY
jgi:lipopolysaccharide export system protein LptA